MIEPDDVETPGYYVLWYREDKPYEVVIAGPYPHEKMTGVLCRILEELDGGHYAPAWLPYGEYDRLEEW